MVFEDETPDTATAAAGAGAEPPAGREVGLREARKMLGELADRARYLDEVAYLTKHGTPVAAVVPAEAARSREQLRRSEELAAAEREQRHVDYERLHRVGDATLGATEVLWARAYLRVWEALDRLASDFRNAVDQAVEAELAAERDQPTVDDPDEDWVYEQRQAGYLNQVNRLRDEEEPRRAFARDIEARVAELTRADARHPGQGEALDWHGWIQRIEQLQAVIAAAGPALGNNTVLWGARGRLATALAEASAMLADLEVTPPAEVPDDVVGYTAKEIWDSASGMFGGPLLTTIASLAKDLRLPAESARWALVELHKAGRIRLFRYFHGYQNEVDPARLHDQAGFHLVLVGPPPQGHERKRPVVIVDM
ncbi:type II toxin-antitoxin system prevent-host-death family antitoxin [Sphaerisporangium fuscum]|uniref:type II toxin-antitoxin system prevent-host-death family antitoxin n=1 Tax=Sphaerisporangium fuscum TaxID=2835868 RepID=UPI001BDDBFFF|nr:type II toxin-antitoxin system prevent-host-death family antitoxin [Sphaerisporangium fuscum]